MLSARAIYRLLIDDEQPVPTPDDPNQLGLDFNTDDIVDPKAEVMRYAQQPFLIRSQLPTDLYQRLTGILNGRPQKKVDRNTYAVRNPDSLAVKFHQTDVVTAYPDGVVMVNSGGWKPGGGRYDPRFRGGPGTTTMARMNDYLCSGWQIYKLKGEWYWFNTTGPRHWEMDVRYPYTDKDKIMADGSLKLQAHPIYVTKRRKRT